MNNQQRFPQQHPFIPDRDIDDFLEMMADQEDVPPQPQVPVDKPAQD